MLVGVEEAGTGGEARTEREAVEEKGGQAQRCVRNDRNV